MATATQDVPSPTAAAPRIRVVFRDGAGEAHLDWPAGRIAEALADEAGVLWVDIDDRGTNLTEIDTLLREVFHFHPLSIEDALQESNVPKVDDWQDYLYLAFQSLTFDTETLDLELAELDLFLGHRYLVTYHGEPIPGLDRLREAIERDGGARMSHGPDHLLYLLLDMLADDFLGAIESLDQAIDDAQDEVFKNATRRTLRKIFRIKGSALKLHRIIIPAREVLNRLARDEFAVIDAEDRPYFRDVYDHLVRLHDVSETLRDLITGALDTYLSAVSNRTNDVMRTLTIVTVMFLPLNVLVGFWGMNFFADTLAFQHPDLPSGWLFWGSCALMALAPVAIWAWSKWRGWF